MSEKLEIDLDFRPNYFGPADLEKHFGARVKGELRRQTAMDMATFGEFDQEVMSLALAEEHRRAAGAIHPHFMGGEYLPDYLDGEVEIARVTLASTTMDVTSIRAHKVGGGYEYRVVDEYEDERETEFDVQPKSSDEPLTLGQVIDIIETCELVSGPRDMNLEGGATAEEIFNFATVTSVFYPSLEVFFSEANEAWLKEKQREEEEEEERWERETKLEAERRDKVLSPYRDIIDQYVLRFGDQMIPNPKWRGSVKLQDVAKKFIEEYVVGHRKLPSGEHNIRGRGYSGAKHDFSDL
jgi:hypothetical protein